MTRARSAGRSCAPRSNSSAYADTALERRAQLVRRVGDEPAQLLLGRRLARERVLDVAEHRVERRAEPADLGPVVLGHPQAQVAARDARRGASRCRAAAAARCGRARGPAPIAASERGAGDDELDHEELVQRPVHLVERQRHQSVPPSAQLLGPHPEVRPAVPLRVDREVPDVVGAVEPRDAGSGSCGRRRSRSRRGSSRSGSASPSGARTSTYAPGAAAASAAWSAASRPNGAPGSRLLDERGWRAAGSRCRGWCRSGRRGTTAARRRSRCPRRAARRARRP